MTISRSLKLSNPRVSTLSRRPSQKRRPLSAKKHEKITFSLNQTFTNPFRRKQETPTEQSRTMCLRTNRKSRNKTL